MLVAQGEWRPEGFFLSRVRLTCCSTSILWLLRRLWPLLRRSVNASPWLLPMSSWSPIPRPFCEEADEEDGAAGMQNSMLSMSSGKIRCEPMCPTWLLLLLPLLLCECECVCGCPKVAAACPWPWPIPMPRPPPNPMPWLWPMPWLRVIWLGCWCDATARWPWRRSGVSRCVPRGCCCCCHCCCANASVCVDAPRWRPHVHGHGPFPCPGPRPIPCHDCDPCRGWGSSGWDADVMPPPSGRGAWSHHSLPHSLPLPAGHCAPPPMSSGADAGADVGADNRWRIAAIHSDSGTWQQLLHCLQCRWPDTLSSSIEYQSRSEFLSGDSTARCFLDDEIFGLGLGGI